MLRLALLLFAHYIFSCQRTDKQQIYGADPDRTGDLLLAKQALSQLSYSPENSAC